MADNALSIRAYAQHRRQKGLTGGSAWSVQKAIREGRISRNAQGKIDPSAADRQWEQNTSPTMRREVPPELAGASASAATTGATSAESSRPNPQGEPPTTIPIPPLAQSRAIREAYQARLARLEYEERTGSLVPTSKVQEAAFQQARLVRDRLMAIPDRLAAELAAITDPRTLRDLLGAELQQALEELSHG